MLLTDNLIAFWAMQEYSGSRADLHAGLTLSEFITTVPAAAGKVYSNTANFDTGNGILERADEAAVSTGDIDFTWAFWLNFNSLSSGNQTLIAKMNDDVNDDMEFACSFFNTQSRLAFGVCSGINFANRTDVQANNFGAPSVGAWMLYIGWHDSVGNTINIQINNGTPDSAAYSFGGYNSTAALNIGRAGNFGELAKAKIGPVMFWKRTLSSGERTTIWNGGNGISYQQLTANGADPRTDGRLVVRQA